MEEYKITVHSENETIAVAQNIESEKFPNMVICLNGDLGSGKTVFTKGFAHAMGIDDVTSPTFTIILSLSCMIIHQTPRKMYLLLSLPSSWTLLT